MLPLRDGEDASYCTINNPVKLCVAKAGSAAAAAAAALSSLLTPSSLLPPPTPSSSSSSMASSRLHHLSPSSPPQPQRERERGQRCRYSCAVMLNVRIRPIHDSAAELRGICTKRRNGAVTKACPHGQIRPFRREGRMWDRRKHCHRWLVSESWRPSTPSTLALKVLKGRNTAVRFWCFQAFIHETERSIRLARRDFAGSSTICWLKSN